MHYGGLNVRLGEDSPVSRNGSSACREAPESTFSTLEAAFRGEAYSSVTIRTQSVLDVWTDRGKHPCLSLGWHSLSVHMIGAVAQLGASAAPPMNLGFVRTCVILSANESKADIQPIEG